MQIDKVNTVLTKPDSLSSPLLDGDVCKHLAKLLRRESMLPIISFHASFSYYQTE